MTLSSAGYLMQYCSGFEKGWAVVNHANLTSVARKQAKRAQAVLKAIYEDQLTNRSVDRNVFDPKGVGFVNCKREAVAVLTGFDEPALLTQPFRVPPQIFICKMFTQMDHYSPHSFFIKIYSNASTGLSRCRSNQVFISRSVSVFSL